MMRRPLDAVMDEVGGELGGRSGVAGRTSRRRWSACGATRKKLRPPAGAPSKATACGTPVRRRMDGGTKADGSEAEDPGTAAERS